MKLCAVQFAAPSFKKLIQKCNIQFTRSEKGSTRFSANDLIIFPENAKLGVGIGFYSGNNLRSIGHFSFSHSPLSDDIEIGNYCSVAEEVSVFGFEHPTKIFTTSPITYDTHIPIFKSFDRSKFKSMERPKMQSVKIGHDVWLGRRALLKSGINIGNGAVVGAGAIVTHDVPPYAVVAGNPARIIKYRFTQKIIERLEGSKWYNYAPNIFNDLDLKDLSSVLDAIEDRITFENLLPPYVDILPFLEKN